MHQLKHISQFPFDLFSEVASQPLVFVLHIVGLLNNWKVDRKVEFFFFFSNYSGSTQMIKKAGFSTAQYPRITTESSSVTNEVMILMNSDQQLHPVPKITEVGTQLLWQSFSQSALISR